MVSSGSTRSSRSTPAVDTTVTRLLVAIKQLLESFSKWSEGEMSDLDVSNVYVLLGNEFNSAVAAFNSFHIDMSDLANVPNSLREVLEAALSNDPSSAVLDVYLPQVRAIITSLLTGLRSKQDAYREAAAARQERRARGESTASRRHERLSSSSTMQSDRNSRRPSVAPDQRSGATVSSQEDGTSYQQASTSRRSQRPIAAPAITQTGEEYIPARYSSRTPIPRTPKSIPAPIPEEEQPELPPVPPGAEPHPEPRTRAIKDDEFRDDVPSELERPSSPFTRQGRVSAVGLGPSRSVPSSRPSRELDTPPMRRGQTQVPRSPRVSERPPTPPPQPPEVDEIPPMPSSPQVTISPSVLSSVKRYSLSDNPVPRLPSLRLDDTPLPLTDVILETTNTVPEKHSPSSAISRLPGFSPPTVSQSDTNISAASSSIPIIEERSLADLKGSEQLGRRASKRYSMYTFAKLVGPSSGSSNGGDRSANRKSMLAPSSLLTPGDLDAVAEEEEGSPALSSSTSSRILKRGASAAREKAYGELTKKSEGASSRRLPRMAEEISDSEAPPLSTVLPTLLASGEPKSTISSPGMRLEDLAEESEIPPPPPPNNAKPSPTLVAHPSAAETETKSPPSPPASTAEDDSSSCTVFLQVGRHVKKVALDRDGLTFASLRVLFVDRFSYNPGASNFPAIYIRDPSSGVQYELEDVEEVQDRCLLSLNIEPLDQIKQQIDTQMSSISQDLRELKGIVISSRRQSVRVEQMAAPAPASPVAAAELPSDKHLQNVAKRLTRVMTRAEGQLAFAREPNISGSSPSHSLPPLLPQMTGTSLVSDERASRMVSDLKTQFDEVQNLRRDLGVMRQIYGDFVSSTKESLSALRSQAQNVRELASAKVGGARAYIDTGKSKLDARSQDILTRVDELQDTVENVRDDVLKRRATPKPAIIRALKADIASTAAELQSLNETIATVKPMWKQTWEEELQNIVEEQQFLSHQEEFIKDLLEDHNELTKVFKRVEDVAGHRGGGLRSRSGPSFRPPADTGGDGTLSTVMLEIRGSQVDPEKRLKAIEANQRLREKELSGRSDEFEDELKGFVDGKKLRMIGGAEEAERVRQHRNDLTLKAMFQTTAPLSMK